MNKYYGSILLVAGTSIGAGMLALPITTGIAGYTYTLLLFVACFLFMLLSLFWLLEATLWFSSPAANFVTIIQERLGPIGKWVAWISFLLLLYAVAAAYISGGGSLVQQILPEKLQPILPRSTGTMLFALVFSALVFFGTHYIDYLNRWLMAGLLGSYLSLLLIVIPKIQLVHLSVQKPRFLWAAVPVVILSFTSHIILPSLRSYLDNDHKQLVKVLGYGSLIPLICYVIWQTAILGVLPYQNLISLANSEKPIAELTKLLQNDLGLAGIALTVGCFSFFALTTSFVGVMLSLSDFLADGLRLTNGKRGRLLLLTVLPPLLFALFYPQGFILALSYAGVFVAVLFGILPVLMVWRGRYGQGLVSDFRVPGGKPLLTLGFMGSVAVILLQMAAVFNWLPAPS